MKLSERYRNKLSNKKSWITNGDFTTHEEICRLEEALDIYQHLIGLGEHHYDEPTLFHMKNRRNAIRAKLRRIAKRENIKA